METQMLVTALQETIELTDKMWKGEVTMQSGEKYSHAFIIGYLQGAIKTAILQLENK
jgi:hypothetical protein